MGIYRPHALRCVIPRLCSQVCYTHVMLSVGFILRYASHCGLYPGMPLSVGYSLPVTPVGYSLPVTPVGYTSLYTCGLYLLVHLWVIPV